jgi:hypothetical protein
MKLYAQAWSLVRRAGMVHRASERAECGSPTSLLALGQICEIHNISKIEFKHVQYKP